MSQTAERAQSTKTRRPLSNVSRYRHPLAFYAFATAIPWALWFTAAWLSRQPDQGPGAQATMIGLGLAGLAAPVVVAVWFIRKDGLTGDVRQRLVGPRHTRTWMWLSALFLLPASLLVATAVSIAFGYDVSQFELRNGFSFETGLMPAWITLALAPFLEELAWHTYGTDALASRMKILWVSLLFGVIWMLWHVPLGFIEGYYQAEVVEEGVVHSINYWVSLVPFVVLMNWLYYRAGRSVLIVIAFHLTANFGNELFLTHPDTKVVQTVLLLVASTVVVWRDRKLFLTPPRCRA